MQKYWKAYDGNDEGFWEHEWSKHGTCISTLEPSCYNRYSAQEEVVDFFQKAVDMFEGLDSYNVGSLGSESNGWKKAEIDAVITGPRRSWYRPIDFSHLHI
jgi:ribonuclease T2